LASNKITLHFMSRGKDLLRVTTFGAQTVAESTIKTYEEIQINRGHLQEKTSEILGLLRSAAGSGYATGDSRIIEKMKELGNDLYRDLVPPSLRSKIAHAAGADMLLSIDGDIVGIPWELLHDGVGFFCRRYNMGRIISIPPSARRAEKKKLSAPVKLLSVADPQGDLPGAFSEGLRIRDIVLDLEDAAEPVFLTNNVKNAHFLDGLRRCDIFHFAGHVDTDENGANIHLADGHCTAEQLRGAAGRYPFPNIVFMNACRSSSQNAMNEGHDRAFDLASSFLLSGSRIFLGTLWDIQDAVASRAGISFFKNLFSGVSVGCALSRMREELINAYGESSMIWAGYLLYGDPGFTIPGLCRIFERICTEMGQTEARLNQYYETLKSSEPQDRFFAACALYQMGNKIGESIIRNDIQVLCNLLQNGSLRQRMQGETVLDILAGKDHSYQAAADSDSREKACRDFLAQWKTRNDQHC